MGMSVYQKVSKNVGSPIAGLCPVKKTNIDELGGPLYGTLIYIRYVYS